MLLTEASARTPTTQTGSAEAACRSEVALVSRGTRWGRRAMQVICQLTKAERQSALAILLASCITGLTMAVAGRDDLLGPHGAIVMIAALSGIFLVISHYYDP